MRRQKGKSLQPLFLALAVGVVCALAKAESAEERKALPTSAAIAAAEKIVHDLFATEYNKAAASNQDRSDFAGKLILQSAETRDDPAAVYVMLRDARDMALNAGDLDQALDAIKSLAQTFQVEAPEARLAALNTASKNDAIPTDALLSGYADTAEMVLSRGDLSSSGKIIGQADSLSRRNRKTPAGPEILKRLRELREITSSFANLQIMQKKLESDPNNEAANAVVGRFTCFVQDDWEHGLALLARGNDPALKNLAAKEQAAPTKLEARMYLADEWWKQGEKLSGRLQRNVSAHSVMWYQQCLPELVGVRKALAEKRIALNEAAPVGTSNPGDRPGETVDAADTPFTNLVRQIPENVFPTVTNLNEPGAYFIESSKANAWLSARALGTALDCTGEVEFVSKPMNHNGKMSWVVEISSPSGRVGDITVRGRLTLFVPSEGKSNLGLTPGNKLRIRGRISRCRINGGGASGKKITSLYVNCHFDSANYVIIK